MKKNAAFALISFAVLKWHECLSFQLPFELTVELPVQLHLELEVNLLVRNVIEREIEREKVQMKPPHMFELALVPSGLLQELLLSHAFDSEYVFLISSNSIIFSSHNVSNFEKH